MPELPEVETIARGLRLRLQEKTIVAVDVRHPGVLPGSTAEAFAREVTGAQVTGVDRRAKMLLVELEGNRTLLVHLRMTGSLIYCRPESLLRPHTHVILDLDDGMQLRFADTRRFGSLKVARGSMREVAAGLGGLGPEPLGDFSAVDLQSMVEAVSGSRRPIKAWMLDQKWIAGIGNIYADEILFAARILPDRLPGSLTKPEIAALHKAIGKVLSAAIEKGGTSFSDYVDSVGEQGEFHQHLKVYRRTGEPCKVCGTAIARVKLAGRSTHYCPECQV